MLLFRFIIISQLIYTCNEICQFTILLVDRLWAWKLSNVISLSNAFQSTFEWCIYYFISKRIFLNFYLIQGLIQWKCNPNNFLLFINNIKKANLRFNYEQLYTLEITFSQYTSLKNYPSCLSLWYYDIFRQHLYWFENFA